MKRVTVGLAAIAVLLTAVRAAEAQTAPARPMAALEARMPALLDSSGIPGVSIAVIRDGRVEWIGAFGVRNAERPEPVDDATVFEAASLTKPLFAYALMKLVDRGEFDLDRPLSEYVEMSQFGDDARLDAVTARMILTHTSGITGYAEGGKVTMSTDPGVSFRYFGDAWLPLQRAVEAATGEPVQSFVEREVFGPLGMRRSSLVWDDLGGNFATPHAESGAVMEKRTFAEGHVAATLHTTASDYARFMIAAMRGEGLSDEAARAWLNPEVEVRPGVAWGLGVGLRDDARGRAFWQWGHWFGSRAYMMAIPATGDGLVFLANSDAGLSIRDALVGAVFGADAAASAGWPAYEQFDSPARQVRIELRRLFETDGAAAGLARMRELEHMAPPDALDEAAVNRLGYDLLRADLHEAAIAVFGRNVERFPESANTHDSLGEAYLEAGRLEEALASYRRSVELNPANAGGRAAIERIREQLDGGA